MPRDYRALPSELTVRATTSNAIQYELYNGTARYDLSAVGTVELWLKNQAGGTSMTDNLTGKLSINGTAGGSITYTPATGDLVAGSAPYHAYFKLKPAGSQLFFPEANELTIDVREAF